MSIKRELSEFYQKQGLTGKHLRKALQWDMRAVHVAIAAQNPRHFWNWDTLMCAFRWSETPQGGRYWSLRSSK